MISFTLRTVIVAAVVVVLGLLALAVALRIFAAFLPAIILWNMRRKSGR